VVGAGVADPGAAVVPEGVGELGGGDEVGGGTQMPPIRMLGGVQLGLALLEAGELDGGVLDWLGVGVGVGVGELDEADALELTGLGAGSPTCCLVGSATTGLPPR
jgi:hypothetical protein